MCGTSSSLELGPAPGLTSLEDAYVKIKGRCYLRALGWSENSFRTLQFWLFWHNVAAGGKKSHVQVSPYEPRVRWGQRKAH